MTTFIHPPFKIALPGIKFLLPCRWEITGYEFDDGEGRFSLSTPDGPAGQYSIRSVPGDPDMERIWEEIHRRSSEEQLSVLRFEHLDSGVLLAFSAPGERFYASFYEKERKKLHEWIFPDDTPEAEREARTMLNTLELNQPDAEGYTFHALFGVEGRIPAGFNLTEIRPYPADVTLEFENRKHHTIRLTRLGMADFMLKDDKLSRFYQERLVRKRYAVKKLGGRSCCGRDLISHEFRIRGRFGLDALLGPWWRGIGEAFCVPGENRIYCLEHVAPSRIPQRECCENIYKEKLGS